MAAAAARRQAHGSGSCRCCCLISWKTTTGVFPILILMDILILTYILMLILSRFCRKPDGKSGICRFCRPLQKPGFPLPEGAGWARERWVFNALTGSPGR